MPGSITRNWAKDGKIASIVGFSGSGCVCPPGTFRYGSSNDTAFSRRRLLNGDPVAGLYMNDAVGKSYAIAYEDRTAVRPSPVTSQATPARGERFPHSLVVPLSTPANPGTPR